jgi:hypothetical protein
LFRYFPCSHPTKAAGPGKPTVDPSIQKPMLARSVYPTMHEMAGIDTTMTMDDCWVSAPRAGVVRTRILLLMRRRDDVAAAILRGIAQYQQLHQDWSVQIDERARTPAEIRWHLAQGWHGVISCNTTPELVAACAEFRLPLSDA